jgi:hypothetical protein
MTEDPARKLREKETTIVHARTTMDQALRAINENRIEMARLLLEQGIKETR